MNIVVLNGSPKGELSVTLHYCKYIELNDPGHDWQFCHGARDVRSLESDPARRAALLEQLSRADLIVWSFPVYYMSVASQFKRFIDILYRPEFRTAVSGKASAVLTTSIHFYDHTALATLRAVCHDLGLRLVGAYSAKMDDLNHPGERERLLANWQEWKRLDMEGLASFNEFYPENDVPALSDFPLSLALPDKQAGKVAIVGDLSENGNLKRMAAALAGLLGDRAVIYDLARADVRQGCLGCCRCGLKNCCLQDGLDGYRRLLDEEVLSAATVVYAVDIKNRLFSWRLKQFWDRSFCHNHVPFLKGRKLGWLVAGPLSANPQILEMIQGMDQMSACLPIGIASDEQGLERCRSQLAGLASEAVRTFDDKKIPPARFTGLAGKKIFRDEIFGGMRLFFAMDHRYYKKNGYYDFPTRNWKTRLLVWLAGPLLKLPPIRKAVQRDMIGNMVRPYQKLLDKLAPRKA